MTSPLDYRRPRDRAEIDAFVEIAQRALFFHTPGSEWVDDEGADNFRVVTAGGELVGGLVWQRVGQYFGGRSVPDGAVRAVAVRPDARAAGVATSMMAANLVEMRDAGFPIATLFPSTQRVYRRVGYEVAGSKVVWKVRLASIEIRDRELEVTQVPAREALPALKELRASGIAGQAGELDRNEWLWRRNLKLRPDLTPRDVWLFGGEGYAVTEPRGDWTGPTRPSLWVEDHVLTTRRAATRFLTFLADHRSMFEEAKWVGGPTAPLLQVLPQPCIEVDSAHAWMLRILDVRGAMEKRGWGPGRAGRLELRIDDEVLASVSGNWTLEVSGGRAKVTEGGEGTLRLDVRGLAALYTGYATAEELVTRGLADGSEEELALATSLFAGVAPGMSDPF